MKDLVKALFEQRQKKESLEHELAKVKEQYNHLEQELAEQMIQEDIERTATYKNIGFVTLKYRTPFYHCPKDNEPNLRTYLVDKGLGDVYKETVHPSTLRSVLHEIEEAGEILPDFIHKHEKPLLSCYTQDTDNPLKNKKGDIS